MPASTPKSISKDKSIDLEFFIHIISYLKHNNIPLPDLIIHLSPTAPFREFNLIDEAIKYIKKNPDSTSLRSVSMLNITPFKIFKKNGKYLKGFFPNLKYEYYNLPNQLFPQTYLPNGQVDIIKVKNVTNKILHGDKILAFLTKESLDIDYKEDLLNLKKYLNDKKYKYINKYLNLK